MLTASLHQLVQHHGDNIRGALQRVGIDPHGDPRIGVAEALAYHRHRDSLVQEQAGVGVAHVVEGDSLDPMRFEVVHHSLCHAGVAQGRSCGRREDEAHGVFPILTRRRLVAFLLDPPSLQRRDQEARHGDRAHTAAALGLAHHRCAFGWPIRTSQRVAHAQGVGAHVYIFPAEGEALSNAQATAQQDGHHGVIVQRGGPTVALASGDGRLHGGEDSADIVTTELLGLASDDGGALGQLDRVARYPVVAHRQSTSAVEVTSGNLSASVGAQLAEPHTDRVHREAGELHLAQMRDDVQPDMLLGALVGSGRPSRLFIVEVLTQKRLHRDVAARLGEHAGGLRLQLLEFLSGKGSRLGVAHLASLWRGDRRNPQPIFALVNTAFALAPFLTHKSPLEVPYVLG